MRSEDLGKLFLRLAVGGLLLMHGIWKIQHHADVMQFIGKLLSDRGLPDWLKWGVYAGEVVGPVLVIIGFLTRPAAFMIVVNMAMAVFLTGMDKVGTLKEGGAWTPELEALYLFGALAIMFLGAGRISLRKGVPKVD